MQNRNRVINKLALVLLSIVVLELVLIGDQVQPVKAIKKKIYLKKLKKLLPLMALLKPKKKIILLPIPVPMFKNHGYQQVHDGHHYNHYGQQPHQVPVPVPSGGMMPPMSFMMMNEAPPQVAVSSLEHMGEMLDSVPVSAGEGVRPQAAAGPANGSQPQTSPPMTMTMTIQSEPGGASAIELSTGMSNGPTPTGALLQQQPVQHHRPAAPNKWKARPVQQQQQQHETVSFEEPGEQYYSSPWASGGQPLVSPAKLIRSRDRPTAQHKTGRPQARPNQWNQQPAKYIQQQHLEQQHINEALEMEDLVPVGPAQLMPVYQSTTGQLHLSLPQQMAAPRPNHEQSPSSSHSADLSDEVQTVGGMTTPVAPQSNDKPAEAALNQQLKSAPNKIFGRLTASNQGSTKGKHRMDNFDMGMGMDNYGDMPMDYSSGGYSSAVSPASGSSTVGNGATGGQQYSSQESSSGY